MKKLFFPLLALLIIAQSCGSTKKKAFDFNQKLVGISTTLQSKGVAIGTELRSAMSSNDFSKIDSMSNNLTKYIDEQIDVVKKTENVGGSEKLKDAMLGFLGFEKEMVSAAFLPFGKLNANSTDAEKQTVVENMLAKSKEEEGYLSKIRDAQREYASKNGFKLEEKKPTY